MNTRKIMTFSKRIIRLLTVAGMLLYVQTVYGNVLLPRLISDRMVLQRNTEVNVWGWASPGEEVTLRFHGNTYQTITGENGKWRIKLEPMKAGGPYSMQIDGENHITLSNILIGEVWICSGQSNMVLPMERVRPLYEEKISQAENDKIRQFLVPMQYDFNAPREMLEGGSWQSANPWSVLNFSATAYFFAKSLYEKYHVPIGLINASVGGTPISAWMSEEALKEFPALRKKVDLFARASYVDSLLHEEGRAIKNWNREIWNNDRGLTSTPPWYSPHYDASQWPVMSLPAFWEDHGLKDINGVVWFRKTFTVPEAMTGKQTKLLLGRIVDADYVYVNGVFVGSTSYKYPPRRYEIAPGILKSGKNIIAVRVINHSGRGGFIKDKPYKIVVDHQTINLKGPWKYKLGMSANHSFPGRTFIQYKPMGLFNGMIAPLTNYTIKGSIWYQGESNTGDPAGYHQKFSAMIKDWRNKWGEGMFPFLFVQLPNFGKPSQHIDLQSGWAKIREAQRKTLRLPNTGMAVTIDVGEWNDVHPLNKKSVGKRLALAAQKVAYGNDKVVYSGPIFKSLKVKDHKIILTFAHTGEGLKTKNNSPLQGFIIAGKDRNFVRAKAEVIGPDKVAVWSQEVSKPVAVRYAWADNPESANLYNKKGLPASPFKVATQE